MMQLKNGATELLSLFHVWARGGQNEEIMPKIENYGMNKKRKIIRGSGTDISVILGDDILYDILSRLRVKSLIQLKCVCKRWKSLIENPYFIDLHLNRSKIRPTILVNIPMERGTSLFSADLLKGDGEAVPVAMNSFPHLMTDPINGLVCLIRKEGIFDSVLVYNPSTQDATPWMKTVIRKDEQKHDHQKIVYCPRYGFGFDPKTKEYKVVCMWLTLTIQTFPLPEELISIVQVCEVLTVGDNSWRKIDEVSPYEVSGPSVYLNGSIYWRTWSPVKESPKHEVLVAFDVGSEKFRVIQIPKFITDYRDIHGNSLPCLHIFLMDEHLALFGLSSSIFKLWILNYDNETSDPTSNSRWTEETFSISFVQQQERVSAYEPISWIGQIIIKPHRVNVDTIYYYDIKKKTFKKGAMTGISSFTFPPHIGGINKDEHGLFQIKPFVESLLPIPKKQVVKAVSPSDAVSNEHKVEPIGAVPSDHVCVQQVGVVPIVQLLSPPSVNRSHSSVGSNESGNLVDKASSGYWLMIHSILMAMIGGAVGCYLKKQ